MADGFKALTVFEPRLYPKAVFAGDDNAVAGPFCTHCGAPEQAHVTGEVQGGTNKGLTITACSPPDGANPMDPRCHWCTLQDMQLPTGAAEHRTDCLHRPAGSAA